MSIHCFKLEVPAPHNVVIEVKPWLDSRLGLFAKVNLRLLLLLYTACSRCNSCARLGVVAARIGQSYSKQIYEIKHTRELPHDHFIFHKGAAVDTAHGCYSEDISPCWDKSPVDTIPVNLPSSFGINFPPKNIFLL